MTDDIAYFVRSRGRVTGPFDLLVLRQRISRGQVARFDDVSTDRVRWVAAGQVEGLFPAPVAAVAPTSTAAPYEPPAASATPPAAADGQTYHYAMNGINVGPVGLDVLKALAQSGALRATDAVWLDGAPVAHHASQLPALAALFAGREPTTTLPYKSRAERDRERAAAAVPSARPAYVASAVLLLLAVLPPLLIVAGSPLWWWNLPPSPATTLGYALFAAIALLVVSLAVDGLGRAITAMALIGLPTVVLLTLSLLGAKDELAVWGVSVVAVAVASSALRGLWHSGPAPARGATVTLGAVACAAAVLLTTMTVVAANEIDWRQPGERIVVVLIGLQAATGLAAGVLTTVAGVMATPRPGLRTAAMITNWFSFGLAGLMLVLCVVGEAAINRDGNLALGVPAVSSLGAATGWLMTLAVRVGVLVSVWVTLCGTATLDLILALRRPGPEAA